MRTIGLMGIIVGAITLATCVSAEAQGSLRPGLYERSLETEVGGATGRDKDTLCISPQEAKDIVKTIAASGKESNCTVGNVKTAAEGKLTFTMTCKDKDSVSTYTNEITYGPDWYSNVSKGKTAQGAISSKVTAKRTGECKE